MTSRHTYIHKHIHILLHLHKHAHTPRARRFVCFTVLRVATKEELEEPEIEDEEMVRESGFFWGVCA